MNSNQSKNRNQIELVSSILLMQTFFLFLFVLFCSLSHSHFLFSESVGSDDGVDSSTKLPPKMSFKSSKSGNILSSSTSSLPSRDTILSSDLYKKCVREKETYLQKLSYICQRLGGADFARLTPEEWLTFNEVLSFLFSSNDKLQKLGTFF